MNIRELIVLAIAIGAILIYAAYKGFSISIRDIPILMIMIGIILMFIGFIILLLESISKTHSGRCEAGGVVIIGPLPIVFGSSTRVTVIVLILAIILTVASIILYILSTRML